MDDRGDQRRTAGHAVSGKPISSDSMSDPEEEPLHEILALDVAGRREICVAIVAVVLSIAVFLLALPFAGTQLGPIAAFVPTYVTALVVCDAVTAALLFGQYRFSGSARLLMLASAYLFTTFATAGYALIFPGLYPLPEWLQAGPQSTSAMYIFWHAGFPLFILAYALLPRRFEANQPNNEPRNRLSKRTNILLCVVSIFVLATTFTAFATLGRDLIPIFLNGDRTTSLGHGVLAVDWLLCFAALLILLRRRPIGTLDLWVVVVLCVWLCDLGLSAVLNTGRYDLGWYVGRIFGMLGASFLLVVLLFDNARNFARMAAMEKDLRAANAVLKQASFLDGLTNIYNRRAFDNYLGRQIAVSDRTKRPLSLILFDIDNFKSYNDGKGHLAGDEALKLVALTLTSCCRRGADMAARYGGEEFAIILPDTGPEGAATLAEYARNAVLSLNIAHDGSASSCLTVSAGVATFGWDKTNTAADLITEADEHLYLAKRGGRNQIVQSISA